MNATRTQLTKALASGRPEQVTNIPMLRNRLAAELVYRKKVVRERATFCAAVLAALAIGWLTLQLVGIYSVPITQAMYRSSR